MATQRFGNSDSGDYTYPGRVRFVSTVPPTPAPLTGPELIQVEIDSLRKRIVHLEACVQRLLNQDDGK